MIEIDALLKDGRSALTDLQGSSPTGGFVTSGSRICTRILPGDLIRHNGAWTVAARTRHDGILGVSAITLIGADGPVSEPLLLYSGLSLEVRADARIDPGTLRKLVPDWPRNSRFPVPGAADQFGPPVPAADLPTPSSVTSVMRADGIGTLIARQETSPSGDRAASEYRGCTTITPGDMVRHNDVWAVTAGTDNDSINGVCGFALIGPDAAISYSGFDTRATVPVRADTRIDPWTLHKLIPDRPKDGAAGRPENSPDYAKGTGRPQAWGSADYPAPVTLTAPPHVAAHPPAINRGSQPAARRTP